MESNVTLLKARLNTLALLCLLLACTQATAQGSMLRINCEGESLGAEVLANGQFKGECPLDMQVQAGSLMLRVVKKVDAGRVRIFEQEVRMGDGIVKRVEVVLGAPELTAEGRKLEDERIQREKVVAQARDVERRKIAAETTLQTDKHVEQILQAKRAQRAAVNAACPDCPPLIMPPSGRAKRTALPHFSDPETEGWMRAIERELGAYQENPQENFHLPAQAQPWPCEGAEANIRRIVGLVNLADETPQKQQDYKTAMKALGAGESSYYFRDIRMWPVQMTCKDDKLDGPVDVWVYSMMVSDNPNHLSTNPSLLRLRFTAANGEAAGALHHVTKTGGGITEYKDAATAKMMKENGVGDFETIAFSYNYPPSAGNARSITVVNSTFSNSKYQDAGEGASTISSFPLGAGRTEQLHYQGARLAIRTLQKGGKLHGPMVLYGQTIKGGFLIPDNHIPDTVHCYREGVLIQANPCNVQ
jgi:hypothetical protein